jgi:hypothetical protein
MLNDLYFHGYFWNACASLSLKRKRGPDTPDNSNVKQARTDSVAGPSYHEWVLYVQWSWTFVTQPASPSESAGRSGKKKEKPRGTMDFNDPYNQEGNAYIKEGKGYRCLGNNCGHTTTGNAAKGHMDNHRASWDHQITFAYFPHHLVFKTDIVISGDAPNAPCDFRL